MAIKPFRRLELWNEIECRGGVRQRASIKLNHGNGDGLRAVYAVEGDESLTAKMSLGMATVAGIVEGRVLRVVFKDYSFEEWRIESTDWTLKDVTVVAKPIYLDLNDIAILYDTNPITGDPIFDFGMASATPREVLEGALANPQAIAKGLPDWVQIGTIDCTQLLDDVTATSASFLTVVQAVENAIRNTGRRAERRFYPVGTTHYQLDIVDQVGASDTTPTFRVGKNVLDLSKNASRRDQATILIPRGTDVGAVSTGIGLSRWVVTAIDSGTKQITVADPAGGLPPILVDGQWVGLFIYREATGKSYQIADSFAPDHFELTSLGTIVVGDYVEFRAGALEADNPLPVVYRFTTVPVIPPVAGIPIIDAEVTALNTGANRITVRDGWGLNDLGLTPAEPVSRDGQHVDRSARLSTLVRTDEITSFARSGASPGPTGTYGFASVAGLQVGDWMRRAVDNTALRYTDIDARIVPAFSAAMTIIAIDAVHNTVTVESRDGGTSQHRNIDDAFFEGLADVRIYRPVDGLRLITASDGDAHTLDLDSVTGFSLGAGPGAVEILITSGESARVVELTHPTRVLEPPAGYGPKIMTLTRDDLTGVSNLVADGYFRSWTNDTTPAKWTKLGGTVVSKNTDPGFTQKVGGNSLHFKFTSTLDGIVSDVIKWQPLRTGSPMSVRMRVLMTQWAGSNVTMRVAFGYKTPTGGYTFWEGQAPIQQQAIVVPPDYKNAIGAQTSRLEGGVFADIVLNGLDLLSPKLLNDFSDIPISPPDADGFVVALMPGILNGGAIEGYFDKVMVTPTAEAVSAEQLSEFGGANQLVQLGNLVLDEISSPLVEIEASIRDLSRLNPGQFSRDLINTGAKALLVGTRLSYHDTPRMTQVEPDYLAEANTKVIFSTRRSLATENLLKGGGSSSGSSGSGGSGGGTTAGPTPPIGPGITLKITFAGAIPTVTATVTAGVVKVKFQGSFADDLTPEDVRGGTVDPTAPFTFKGPALALGDTWYVAAFAYDNNGVESPIARESAKFGLSDPWLYVRTRTNYFEDAGKTDVAETNDPVYTWAGAGGTTRDLVHRYPGTPGFRPLVQKGGAAIRFGDELMNNGPGIGITSKRGAFEMLSMDGFTEAEIILVLQRAAAPISNSDGAPLFQLGKQGNDGDYFPKASDGHWWSTFGSTKNYDLGALPDAVLNGTDGPHWIRLLSSATRWAAYGDWQTEPLHEDLSPSPAFDQVAPVLGENVLGGHFNGWIWTVVEFNRINTDAEAAAWVQQVMSDATGTAPGGGGDSDDEDDEEPPTVGGAAGEEGDVQYNHEGALAGKPFQDFGRWEPLTNGDPDNPELIFSDGDVIMAFRPG